jgi:hypothetical protein
MRRTLSVAGAVAIAVAACGGTVEQGARDLAASDAAGSMADRPALLADLALVVDTAPAPSCSDGIKNGGESDVDCGGPCPPCESGLGCGGGGDCASGICDSSTCRLPRSCFELHAVAPGVGSGQAQIDPDGAGPAPVLTVRCDMTSDGGGFTLVFSHDLPKAGYLTGFDEALRSNEQDPTAAKYSILEWLGRFARGGVYTLRIDWPGYGKRNLWSQTTSPTDDVAVAGYVAIDVQATAQLWGGLELGNGTHGPQNGNASYLDGSVNSATWYYAIGVRVPWGNPNGFPASDDVAGSGAGVNQVELWVR